MQTTSLVPLNTVPSRAALIDLEACCKRTVSMLEAQFKKNDIPYYHDLVVCNSILRQLEAIPVDIRNVDKAHWISELTSVLEFAQLATVQALDHQSTR